MCFVCVPILRFSIQTMKVSWNKRTNRERGKEHGEGSWRERERGRERGRECTEMGADKTKMIVFYKRKNYRKREQERKWKEQR